MRYEKPALSIVDDARAIILGLPFGDLDNAGTPPHERIEDGVALGLDD
jgi:hypothetical protein